MKLVPALVLLLLAACGDIPEARTPDAAPGPRDAAPADASAADADVCMGVGKPCTGDPDCGSLKCYGACAPANRSCGGVLPPNCAMGQACETFPSSELGVCLSGAEKKCVCEGAPGTLANCP